MISHGLERMDVLNLSLYFTEPSDSMLQLRGAISRGLGNLIGGMTYHRRDLLAEGFLMILQIAKRIVNIRFSFNQPVNEETG